MCGRATLTSPVEDIAEAFGVSPIPIGPPRFNIAPSQELAVVRLRPDEAPSAQDLRGIQDPGPIQGWIVYSTGAVQPTCNHLCATP